MKQRRTVDITHTGPGGDVRAPVDCTDKAEYAAGVIARRIFGRGGYCRTLHCDSWAEDGSSYTYEAFVGYSFGNGCTGRNIRIYV